MLWGIDAHVDRGDIVCIVGSNGAGKTTLLRSVSGALPASSGRVLFDGEDITHLRTDQIVDRGIAHVPEGRRLFRGLSVKDNLLLGAHLRRNDTAIKRDLDFVFAQFPILKERQYQDATTLSGGEQQMCAIGRGMMSKPRLLMIDELSLGLAPRIVEELGTALIEINKAGLTILLIEQDVLTAFEMAKNAFVIETGRVSLHGDTTSLAKNPAIRQAYLGM